MFRNNSLFAAAIFLALCLISASLWGCQSNSRTDIICGGAMNFGCPADMYCKLSVDCGGFDKEGICVIRPTECRNEENLVCGCDKEEYINPCFAAAKGITIRHTGACLDTDAKRQ